MVCCHRIPNTFNVPPETSLQTKQYSACTKSTPWRWRPPGSAGQASASTTHCSLACQPGGRCWCCTRWFAGFVAGTVEGGVHVGPHADVFGGRAVEGDITSRRRRNWRTLVPVKRRVLQHFLHNTFVQGQCHYNCRSVCPRVARWWVHVAARQGPVDQLCLRADFKEAEVGFNTIHCAPVQRHVVVTMRVAPRS